MSAKSSDFMAHFAYALRQADPKSYQAFLEAFDAYTMEITVAVTETPAAEILNMQGRAAQTRILLKLLANPKPLNSPPPQPTAP